MGTDELLGDSFEWERPEIEELPREELEQYARDVEEALDRCVQLLKASELSEKESDERIEEVSELFEQSLDGLHDISSSVAPELDESGVHELNQLKDQLKERDKE